MAQLKDGSTMGGDLLAKDMNKANKPHQNESHSEHYSTESWVNTQLVGLISAIDGLETNEVIIDGNQVTQIVKNGEIVFEWTTTTV